MRPASAAPRTAPRAASAASAAATTRCRRGIVHPFHHVANECHHGPLPPLVRDELVGKAVPLYHRQEHLWRASAVSAGAVEATLLYHRQEHLWRAAAVSAGAAEATLWPSHGRAACW